MITSYAVPNGMNYYTFNDYHPYDLKSNIRPLYNHNIDQSHPQLQYYDEDVEFYKHPRNNHNDNQPHPQYNYYCNNSFLNNEQRLLRGYYNKIKNNGNSNGNNNFDFRSERHELSLDNEYKRNFHLLNTTKINYKNLAINENSSDSSVLKFYFKDLDKFSNNLSKSSISNNNIKNLHANELSNKKVLLASDETPTDLNLPEKYSLNRNINSLTNSKEENHSVNK